MTSEVKVGDPNGENMNNFYLNMPKGLNRGAESFDPESIPAQGLTVMMRDYSQYLDQPEESWPKDKAYGIAELKKKVTIHRAVDEFLEDKPELRAEIESRVEAKGASWSHTVDDDLIRPVYIHLRGSFSHEDLTQ